MRWQEALRDITLPKMDKRAFLLGATATLLPITASGSQAPTIGADRLLDNRFVNIGGISQWIEVRGSRISNPVLLVVHGGPGSTWEPFTEYFREWERHFTMVYWSQRGAGKTAEKNGPPSPESLTIDLMVQDGLELASYLQQHFRTRRVILLCHSFGTVLGIKMVQKKPALFSAYVGTGQVVNSVQDERAGYAAVLAKAKAARRDDAVNELKSLGQPPYDDIQKMVSERKWEGVFDTPSDAKFDSEWKYPAWFSKADQASRYKSWLASNLIMYGPKQQNGPVMGVDFTRTARDFLLPIIFIQGAEDQVTPAPLVQAYVSEIKAPKKAFVLLPGGGHNSVFALKDMFLAHMISKLRDVGVRVS